MPTTQYAKLSTALRGFEQPDTTSTIEGKVQPGKYRILKQQMNFPSQDTDYVLLEVPYLGDEDTWICTRWKGQQYAEIVSEESTLPVLEDFSQDEMAIPESALTDLAANFYPFTYDLDQARYPFEITGFKAPQAPPQQNNCCTFVEALIAKAWENSIGYKWSKQKHAQMMIYSNDDYFSPITCLVESGIGMPVNNPDQLPHPWSVVQGWRKQWNGGHTFIILAYHETTDHVLTLESNSSYQLNGVGFRGIGNLRDFPSPPVNWWERTGLWTWERMKSVYRHRKMCTLKVTDQGWASAPNA